LLWAIELPWTIALLEAKFAETLDQALDLVGDNQFAVL